MYSFGVSGWYGVGMSNWSVYKRVGICMYWGMSVSVSIHSWSGNGNSSLTNRIDESILVNIFRETFEVKRAGTTWGGYKISPCWGERSCWESRLEKLWVGCRGGRSYGGDGQNDKCLHCNVKMLRRN